METQKSKYLHRWTALKNERSSWMSHWREISDYLLPRSGRFFSSDRNRGEKRHNNIMDSTATRAQRVLSSGMMSNMTSPARPWFRLAIADADMMEYGPVKIWLNDVTSLMRDVFQRSNTYRALHTMYEELGAFGTSASIILDDFNDVIRHYPLTAGEYAIATDYRGEVETLYREFDMTVLQMVKEFGIDSVSDTVRNMYTSGKALDAWVTILHVVEPRQDRDVRKRDSQNMRIASCYYEIGGNDDKELRSSGFKAFPALVPRWSVSGGDIYGNSPGMEALGDIKQLQHDQLRKAQAIDYQVKPPIMAPTSTKNGVDVLPGGVTYYDAVTQSGGIRQAFDVRLDLSHLLADIQDVRGRINQTFYADLFLMLQQDSRSNITAREIAERHEEKLLMLGPVLERLENEMLKPKIDITFTKLLEAGLLPPPPEELHGADLSIEFVSVLAQAQRALGTNNIDRLLGTIGSMAALGKPEALDKLDTDEIVEAYGDMLGVDPSLIVADEKVALIRQERAKQQAAMQQAAMTPVMADSAKKLSETDTEGKNGLTDAIKMFSGYGG